MTQLSLFGPREKVDASSALLYALGEFQARGKALADRELAFDRLRGAFLRAFQEFGVEPMNDREIADELIKLGSRVIEVPTYVAKHPFRITVPGDTAELARTFYTGLELKKKKAHGRQNKIK